MMYEILLCQKCSTFTLEKEHCSEKTIPPKPPKFSPSDKYAAYKRKVKEPDLRKKGLL